MPAGAPRCTGNSIDGEMMSFLESRQQVAPQGIGKPLRRREDERFLTGAGKYADDMNLPGQAYAYVVRSPHAHARIARHRCRAGGRCAGCLGGPNGQRRGSGRAAADPAAAGAGEPARGAAQEPRRLAVLDRAAPGSGARQNPLCRRTGRCGHCRDIVAGDGCCRTPRGRVLPAARGHTVGGRAGAEGAARLGRARYQSLRRLRSRRQGSDRARLRRGGACRAAGDSDQPGDRRSDGVARGGRGL